MTHKGLALKRIKKLIWVGGGYQAGMNCYILNTSGFNDMHRRIAFDLCSDAMAHQRALREAAYHAPQLFPLDVLTLGELAQIAHAQTKRVDTTVVTGD